MATDRSCEERALWLRRLRDYVRGASFSAERRSACDEYLGALALAGGLGDVGRLVAGAEDPSGALVAADEAAAEDAAAREALEARVAESDWFLFHRCDSRWDRTPVELFVARTPDLPAHVTEGLLACARAVRSVFAVVAGDAEAVVLADQAGAPDDLYRVRLCHDQAWVQPGLLVSAQVVRWAGEYWFLGRPERWPLFVSDVLGDPSALRPAPTSAREADERAPVERVARRAYEGRYGRANWLRRRRDEG